MEFKDFMIEELLYRLEAELPVERIIYDGISLWPFFRVMVFRQLYDARLKKENVTKKRGDVICESLKNHVDGFLLTKYKLFKRHNGSLLFVTNFQGKFIDGKLVNKLTAELENNLTNIIPIMQINSKKTKKMYGGNYINEQLINDLISFNSRRIKIDDNLFEGEAILLEVIEALKINFDYVTTIKRIISGIRFYQEWFKKTNPNVVIIECYYDFKMCAIYAAKSLGIKTVEVQHGTIVTKTIGYNTRKLYANNPFPHWLLCFGEAEKKEIGINKVYINENMIPVGAFFLEYIKTKLKHSQDVVSQKYPKKKLTITVIGQYTVDDVLMQIIAEISRIDTEIMYIYVPRIIEDKHRRIVSNNVAVEEELDVYTLMQASDVTISVHSTCVLESVALGTSVMLVDINGFASYYFGELSENVEPIIIRKENEVKSEYINTIKELSSIPKERVMAAGEYLFKNNHSENIKSAIKTINQSII